jgi:hypothetical protein
LPYKKGSEHALDTICVSRAGAYTTMDCSHIKIEPADSVEEPMDQAPPAAPSSLEQALHNPVKVEGAIVEPTSEVDTHCGSQTDVSIHS